MPRQPVNKNKGLPRHPVSPKGVLLRLKVRSSHPRRSHLRNSPQEAFIQKAVIEEAVIQESAIHTSFNACRYERADLKQIIDNRQITDRADKSLHVRYSLTLGKS